MFLLQDISILSCLSSLITHGMFPVFLTTEIRFLFILVIFGTSLAIKFSLTE